MNYLNDIDVLVLGLGDSGLAMARWCARHRARVRVWDSREAAPQDAALAESLPQLKIPVNAIWGERDQIAYYTLEDRIARIGTPAFSATSSRLAALVPSSSSRSGGCSVAGCGRPAGLRRPTRRNEAPRARSHG